MTFERFVETLAVRSQYSAKTYGNRIKLLSGQAGFASPDELAISVRNGETDPYLFLERIILDSSKKGLSPKTIYFSFAVMKRFFEDEAEIEWQPTKLKRISRIKPKAKTKSLDGVPTNEEVYRLLQRSSLRTRLFLLLGLTTGMRISEIAALMIGWIDFKMDPVSIHLPAEVTKARERRTAFTTSECVKVLKEWIGDRTEGPVFPNRRDSEKPSTPHALYFGMMRVLERTGLRKKLQPDSYMYGLHPHSLRKFFHTRLESAGCPKGIVDRIIGHDEGVDSAYTRLSDAELGAHYAKHVPILTFMGAAGQTAAEQEERLKEMQERLEKLESIYSEKLKIKESG